MAIDLPFPISRRIAIVGKAPSSLGLAPYHDDTWQIWTLSDLVLCGQAPRYDVQFELHDVGMLKRERPPYWDWLTRAQHKPLVVREAVPELPGAIVFPKDEIVSIFGRYFTNTVSWLIALAIAREPEEIGVWGVDMACDQEYSHQRPSCEYFLGWAAGCGITVTIPPQADLLKTPGLYGFDAGLSDMHAKWKARREELKRRVSEAETRRDQAASEALFLSGALDDAGYWGQWCHGEK